jgi:NAD-dependent DNA ligase/DNA polymerase/3'-5' exonuclease PolX
MSKLTLKKHCSKKHSTLLKQKLIKNNKKLTISNNNDMAEGKKSISTKTLNASPNKDFIKILEELANIMKKKGETFRHRAYTKGASELLKVEEHITSADQLKKMNIPNIGKTIIEKFKEYLSTGTLEALEKEKQNPINIFTEIYGIGPKKAEELIEKKITTIEELEERQNEIQENKHTLLNDKQKIGLKYYRPLLKRIPRSEIEKYYSILNKLFIETIQDKIQETQQKIKKEDYKFEIVGSYRRGKPDSGDIDVIITSKLNDKSIFDKYLTKLKTKKILIEILSKGDIKSLTIGKLPSESSIPRRLDFLYSPPDEYPFAVLYFTGSKEFNTAMRQHALSQGLTLNEHGFHSMNGESKGDKITSPKFTDEKDIFSYLNMEYKEPDRRIDEDSVVIKKKPEQPPQEQPSQQTKSETLKQKQKPKAKNETIKKHTKKSKENIITSIEKFKKEGITVLYSLSEDELTEILKLAIDNYYEANTTILSDDEYDILRDYVLKKYPENKVAKEQHTQIKIDKNKVKLPYEMWSMDKIKPDTNALNKFKEKYKGPYVISTKLDGISALYVNREEGAKMYTRGNGTYGQDITHLIPYLLKTPTSGVVIRGEIIIKRETFDKKYKNKFANPRNFVAGIVNKKTIDPNIVKDLDFVAYELIYPIMKPHQQMLHFSQINFNHVKFDIKEDITNENLSEILIDWRENYEYEIDGIIIVNDEIYPRPKKNPEHAFAFKMIISDNIAEAKVLDVLWTASKDGLLKPRVQIEPVTIGGTTVNYATGFNARYIVDNNIGIGATVKLTRSGDVIPHIIETTKPATMPLLPKEEYYWNDTEVDIILQNKDSDETVHIKTITKFFKDLEVEGLGEKNIKRIIDSGADTVAKIIALTPSDLQKVENFKEKMATKINNSIEMQIGKASLGKIAAATNIFGRGFGEKRINIILESEPQILIDTSSENESIKKVKSLEGLAEKTATQFVKKIPEFLKFLKSANLTYKLEKQPQPQPQEQESQPQQQEPQLQPQQQQQPQQPHQIFKDKVIVLSDFKSTTITKKELTNQLELLGAKIESNLTNKTNILIVGDITRETGKMKKAKEKSNIDIIELEEFMQKYLS